MIYAFEEYEFDAVRLELRRNGAVTKAEPLVLRVLSTLVRNAGRLVTKEELAADAWSGRVVADNVITLSMARLRKVLQQRRGARALIVTVHGLGYRFVGAVVVRSESGFANEPPAVIRGPAPPLVGRSVLLEELRQCIADAEAGRGRLCVLMGEPGIGKSHVVGALADELLSRGVQVAWGFCRESGSTPPLYPWSQLVRKLFDAGANDAASGALTAEVRALLSTDEAAEDSAASPAQAARPARLPAIGSIARAFLQAADERPLVLVLEDLHRADAASLEVLSLLVDEIGRSRVLVLATVRTPAGGPLRPSTQLPYILGHSNAERFVLRHLHEDDVAQYVAAIVEDPSGALGRAVFDKSRGNPFFMAELARQLRRDGKTVPGELSLPHAALDIIRQHVAGFDLETRDLLTAASVIGVRFELPLLQAIVGLDASATARALDAAIAADLLVTAPDSRDELAFRHELLRAVLYEAIPPVERRRRHLQIALAMEQRATVAHVTVPMSELADHFYAALPESDLGKTVHYCDMAARAACTAFANTDVARHMKHALAALALMPSPPLPLRIELLYRLALYSRGSAPEFFVKTVQEVVRLAREAGDAKMLVRGARMHQVHPEIASLPGATEALEHALTIIPDTRPDLRAIALATLATTAPRAYDERASHAAIDEAEVLARSTPRDDGLRIVLVCKLFTHGGPDRCTRALTEELERLVALKPTRAPIIPLFLSLHRTMRAVQRGQQRPLFAAIEAGLAHARTMRHPELLWHFERFQALAKINAGACELGKSLLKALHERNEARSLLNAGTFCAFDRLVVLPEFGDTPVVDDATRRALAYQPWDPVAVWALKLRALAAAGLIDEARAALAAVPANKLVELPHDSQYLGTLGQVARAALTVRAPDYLEALDALLAPFDDYFAANVALFCEGSVAQLRGMIAAALGDAEKGRMLLERGLAFSERAGYVACAAEARLDLARSLQALGLDAAPPLMRAVRMLSERHGLRRTAQRATTMLTHLPNEPLRIE